MFNNSQQVPEVPQLVPDMGHLDVEASFELWEAFPDDVKEKVIKSMDLKSRYRLRCSSKDSKELVDFVKMKGTVELLHLDNGAVTMKGFKTDNVKEDLHFAFNPTNQRKTNQLLPFLAFILNNCEID